MQLHHPIEWTTLNVLSLKRMDCILRGVSSVFQRPDRMGDMMSLDKNLTTLAHRAQEGDREAAEFLYDQVYSELHFAAEKLMRHERPGATIQPTALVHDAFIRIAEGVDQTWLSSEHFLNTAALIMRRLLIDHARKRGRLKRGAGFERIPLDHVSVPAADLFEPDEIELVHESLERLASQNRRCASVIEYRVFLGLTIEQTAQALDVSTGTVKSDARFAMTWLRSMLAGYDKNR